MPDTFTPEQISQILEEFFKVVGTRQYIGARYVPIFGRKDEETIEWDNTAPYEPLTIVLYQGNSYTSRQYVPVGVEITNQEFWAITGNYNAQVEQYRRETAAVREIAEAAQDDINTLLPKSNFSAENTVKKYVDDSVAKYGNMACVDYYGADPTGTNDSADAINACILANKGGVVWFNPKGVYKINAPIVTPHLYNERVSLDFCGATVVDGAALDAMIIVGGVEPQTSGEAGIIRTFINNGNFKQTNGTETCIKIVSQYKDLSINACNIIEFKCGVDGGATDVPIDLNMNDCNLFYTGGISNGSIGVHLRGSDSKLSNCRIYGFNTCVMCDSSGNILFNLHCLPKGYDTTAIAESVFIQFNKAGHNEVLSCYCDTYATFVKYGNLTDYAELVFTNNFQMAYRTDFALTCIDFTNVGNQYVYAEIRNNTFAIPATNQNHRGIVLPASNTFSKVLLNKYLNIDGNNVVGEGISVGDLLCASNRITPFWPSTNVSNNGWVKLCSIPLMNQQQFTQFMVSTYGEGGVYCDLISVACTPSNNAIHPNRSHIGASVGYQYGFTIRHDETTNAYYLDVYARSQYANVTSSVSVSITGGQCPYVTFPSNTTKLINAVGDTAFTPAATLVEEQ